MFWESGFQLMFGLFPWLALVGEIYVEVKTNNFQPWAVKKKKNHISVTCFSTHTESKTPEQSYVT